MTPYLGNALPGLPVENSRDILMGLFIGMLIGGIIAGGAAYAGLLGQQGNVDRAFESINSEISQIWINLNSIKTSLEQIQDSIANLEEISKRLENQLQKLDSIRGDIQGLAEELWNMRSDVTAILEEVNRIEQKLDNNGINVEGEFKREFESLVERISQLDVEVDFTDLLDSISDMLEALKQDLISELSESAEYIIDEINFLMRLALDDLTEVIISELYDATDSILEELDVVKNSITNIINRIDGLQTDISEVNQRLTNIERRLNDLFAKTQKKVDIEATHVYSTVDPLRHKLYVNVVLQGEGGVNNTRITRVTVLGTSTESVNIQGLGEPGIYLIDIRLSPATETGIYTIVVEAEVDLPLPSGDVETFKGRKIVVISVRR